MSPVAWLLEVVSQHVCWEQNTRPNRRDDPVVAEIKALDRRAGYSQLWATSAFVLMLLWALLGPSAGEPPYRGAAFLIHWTDRIVFGHWVLSTLWAALTTYQALTYLPARHDEEE